VLSENYFSLKKNLNCQEYQRRHGTSINIIPRLHFRNCLLVQPLFSYHYKNYKPHDYSKIKPNPLDKKGLSRNTMEHIL